MIQNSQSWMLFGYDVRHLGKSWQAAWREFLWGYDSPVKARFDEVVNAHREDGSQCYHAGEAVPSADTDCEAIFLPESLVLTKTMELPLAVESDLDAVMALELNANNPFSADDTGFGWKVVGRMDSSLKVQLAIVSLSATMSYLGREYDCHDLHAYEVWAEYEQSAIVLNGFGENKRLARYNKRLRRIAALLACAALMVLLVFGVAAVSKYFELKQIEALSAEVQAQASDVVQMRNSLAVANETIVAVNELVATHPSAHYELARLSALLDDSASIMQLSIKQKKMKLRGLALDAAEVVQLLTDEPGYAKVTAPQAISKYGNSGMEQFFLDIDLAGSAAP